MTINDGGLNDGYTTTMPIVSGDLPSKKPVYKQEPIAVVGMACRLPGNSNSPTALWDLLMRGGIAGNDVPESRFDLSTHYDGSKKPKTMRSPGGMFLENIDPRNFDASFFATSHADATAMDPQQRQLLEVVYECLENAGATLESLDGAAVACLVGSYSVDYEQMQARDPEDRVPSVTIGVGRAILSNRISHFLNIKGPSMTVDTACSGSLVSLDVACRYLTTGEVDGAIVAGANMYLSPEHNLDSGAMKGASSLSGKCHTFDVKADGYIKAEGINAVYLKRVSDAIRDNDPILAVIRGSSTNSDGRTPGIASPSAEAQATAIRAAYSNAGLSNFNDTSYLEFHGTGTQAGDPTEVRGVASVFSPSRDPQKPLFIGSVKSNIGHSEPAAGISGLLKAVLCIENGMIPGNPTFIDPNPKIDFTGSKVSASRVARRWPDALFKRASVNSFGYGGSNAHVVLEEAASFTQIKNHVSSYMTDTGDFFGDDEASSPNPYTLVFSANDDESLQANFATLRAHLMNPKVKVDLADLAYTLSERRTKHFSRGYIVTSSKSLDAAAFMRGKKNTDTPKIGFVFTGQGAQWPQMGQALVDTFPSAKEVLNRLDNVLQSLPDPPSWHLLDELTQPRSAEALRQPEFSQPLVTALQLVIVDILKGWGISPQSVVGHSSGEIAAAYTAGLVSEEDAIIAAFYRGYASTRAPKNQELGMLAAGISASEFPTYAQGLEDLVTIACFNSPQSITISGPVTALEQVRTRLVDDKKFARLLQVDLAYHSKFMDSIGADYNSLLSQKFSGQNFERNIRMFSSVTGQILDRTVDVEYWRSNMVSPVLFDQAVKEMLSSDNNPDFLIEIGPSGALAGPIKQIKTDLGDEAANIQYCAALARGRDAVKSLYDTAGKLFVAGSPVNLSAVNQLQRAGEKNAVVIVDLPNYSWNYSTKYWYENDSSNDWRYRMFPHHDLLGSKILSTSWNEPSFKKILQLENLPWLKDHKMGTDIIFPAAGFLAMAIEAMRQKTHALTVLDGKPEIKSPSYRLRNLTFSRALVLEERKEHKVMLTLAPKTGSGNTWHSYRVSSMVGGSWQENSRGLIKVEEQAEKAAPEDALKPLQYPTDGRLWYKAMNDAGYGFGPAFQKQLQVESVSGKRFSRSIVSLEEPKSADAQSPYPLHPAVMDGCFQTSAPSLWRGNRSDVNAVLIPAIIDEVIINQQSKQCNRAIALSTSKYVGVGRQDVPKNYLSNSSVYDPETGILLFQLSGLRYHKLDTNEEVYSKHTYSQVVWKPDITTLSGSSDHFDLLGDTEESAIVAANRLLDLAAHKKPHLSVFEINQVTGDSNSIWLNGSQSDVSARIAYRRYRFTTAEPADLMAAQEAYSSHINIEFDLLDIETHIEAVDDSQKFDLVILKVQDRSNADAVTNARRFLGEGACLVLLEHEGKVNGAPAAKGGMSNGETNNTSKINGVNGTNGHQKANIWKDMIFVSSKIFTDSTGTTTSVSIGISKPEKPAKELKARRLNLLHFADPSIPEMKLREKLIASGWDVTEYSSPFMNLDPNGITVVLEFGAPIMSTITEEYWEELKNLLTSGNKLLWVTEGSQMDVTNPTKAMIHGLARTVRAEDPSVNITTLDVEEAAGPETLAAVIKVLGKVQESKDKKYIENEFVERRGLVHVPRVLPDNAVNRTEATEVETSLHDAKTTIRLQCERIGTLDDLHYQEVATTELLLEENKVEVEVYSAGLNFKDIAVTMGIVPENEYLLGLEGAGIVRRVHPSVTKFRPGDRVLVFEKGTFANRIILTTERTSHIPNSMSFEEASTLASVYLTALYSIYDLANTQKGHRVLIHSASGGLGQASIQICQHIGAEIFATVGNEEKKKYLIDNFGIPEDHIFGSRTTDFASKLMSATDSAGVDVIINTLTEDLLDESWRCIATGGTMVELGKKDMIDRNFLSMEPFGRNASYRAFDLSHKSVTDQLIGRLLNQLMGLVSEGSLKPIGPIKTFSFTEIPSAFRYMRGANHIGKIVITDGPDAQIKVPTRPASRTLALRDDVSYLIVGGLKGLCGTMAVQMARHGAKHLIILSRSGCGDEKSQAALQQINANGCLVTDFKGDVAKEEDVQRCFDESPLPVGGIIQGAMVLRDRVFMSMTISDYHQAIEAKLKGTWNLHNVSIEKDSQLDFFTMLSSVSGVVGQRGQANYAAANVFLDNFANYRRKLGFRACSVDLGAIQDIGYLSEHTDILQAFDPSWTPINEALFTKIFRNALLQDIAPLYDVPSRGAQLITGIAVPQPDGSRLLADARFAGLDFGTAAGGDVAKGGDNVSKDVQALLLLLKSGAKQTAVMKAALEAVNQQFVLTLRLSEPMEPGKPLTSYGMDSLTAVEFRNWARSELKVELTALEIANASSLHALCEKIVSRMAKS